MRSGSNDNCRLDWFDLRGFVGDGLGERCKSGRLQLLAPVLSPRAAVSWRSRQLVSQPTLREAKES